MLLNGLFGHLFGPIEGYHNNTFTLVESGLMDECALHTKLPGGQGDEAGDEGSNGTDASTEPHLG